MTRLLARAGVLALLLLAGAVPASAEVVGTLAITPQRGTDATLFSGVVLDARCPAGTADSYFSIDGPGLPRDQAILAPGNVTGTGRQAFSTQSVANLKSINSGSFLRSGTYTVRFNCVRSPDGRVTSTYERGLRYTAAGGGSWALTPPPRFVAPPAAAPTSPVSSAPASGGAASPGAGVAQVPGTSPSGVVTPSGPPAPRGSSGAPAVVAAPVHAATSSTTDSTTAADTAVSLGVVALVLFVLTVLAGGVAHVRDRQARPAA